MSKENRPQRKDTSNKAERRALAANRMHELVIRSREREREKQEPADEDGAQIRRKDPGATPTCCQCSMRRRITKRDLPRKSEQKSTQRSTCHCLRHGLHTSRRHDDNTTRSLEFRGSATSLMGRSQYARAGLSLSGCSIVSLRNDTINLSEQQIACM